MAKHADGPKSGRMVFGFWGAAEIGAPFYRTRSAKELNQEARKKAQARRLNALLAAYPEFARDIRARVKKGQAIDAIKAYVEKRVSRIVREFER